MKLFNLYIALLLLGCFTPSNAQTSFWHDSIRKVHYLPKGDGFELIHGERKFNRALYGTNTGFRVEAGDLPEFAMYMPGMGGNFKLGMATNKGLSKWITESDTIHTLYSPGVMSYTIRDRILKSGELKITVVALAQDEGFVLRLEADNIPEEVGIIWIYGGASGKKFHRDGDIGADPESVFYLQPEYCIDNTYQIKGNSFKVSYGSRHNKKKTGNNKSIHAVFPESTVKIASASNQKNPLNVFQSKESQYPLIAGKLKAKKKIQFWKFQNDDQLPYQTQKNLQNDFETALQMAKNKANVLEVETPDPFINTLGGALATAADAIWEHPAFLHGSIAWRMHLNAWRGAYVADPLGWKDRAESHFYSYANSQVINPPSGPVVPDTTRNFARQKEEIGTAMFSSGYISRRPNNNTVAHHYDMNSVFFNQVLRHYKWTGNKKFIEKMWPYLERHLAWEKRNFDVDNNYLYDAYACIWASDALQYSGGSVSYASSYNLNANRLAYAIGRKLQKSPASIEVYKNEADHIQKALNQELWIPTKGIFAEYKDLLGNQLVHDHPGIWSIYHPIDEGVTDPFQSYQMLRYIDTEIPHIPVKAIGLPHEDLSLVATTNWQPYTWSVNNVALAEVLHTSLAYWQGQRPEKAYNLWQSAIIESMYLGASPGGFQQLSFYDAMRGELYRDFADPIGMAARSLAEGLFGIQPNALSDTLHIQPGFPSHWNHARIKLPDLRYNYTYKDGISNYKITPYFSNRMALELVLEAKKEAVEYIKINQREITDWHVDTTAVVHPKLVINAPYKEQYSIEVKWKGSAIEKLKYSPIYTPNSSFKLSHPKIRFINLYDPQSVFKSTARNNHDFSGQFNNNLGNKTFFIKLQQGAFSWWEPIDLKVTPPIELATATSSIEGTKVQFNRHGKTNTSFQFSLNHKEAIALGKQESSLQLNADQLVSGTNLLEIKNQGTQKFQSLSFQNWDIKAPKSTKFVTLDLANHFNGKLTHIFKESYLSPRPSSPTLQLPIQGIGNWCYPNIAPDIDDSGLKKSAAKNNGEIYYQNIPFAIPSKGASDVIYTSLWDNYPEKVKIPLSGKASHIYLLMAGTTNPMQSRLTNGRITVYYKDGTTTELNLNNPETWWPIEQDYYTDDYAFKIEVNKPPRLHLKTGKFHRKFNDYSSIKGFTDYAIDGGSATLLDLVLDPNKTLDYLELTTKANEVIIGIMSITLLK